MSTVQLFTGEQHTVSHIIGATHYAAINGPNAVHGGKARPRDDVGAALQSLIVSTSWEGGNADYVATANRRVELKATISHRWEVREFMVHSQMSVLGVSGVSHDFLVRSFTGNNV